MIRAIDAMVKQRRIYNDFKAGRDTTEKEAREYVMGLQRKMEVDNGKE